MVSTGKSVLKNQGALSVSAGKSKRLAFCGSNPYTSTLIICSGKETT